MRHRALLVACGAAAAIALAGCGGAGGADSGQSTPTLSSGDDSACQSLEFDTAAGNEPAALNTDFGLNGRRMGTLSARLKPYAQLVGANAQLLLSGADDGKLGEYVGQMRGVCESMGWHTSQ